MRDNRQDPDLFDLPFEQLVRGLRKERGMSLAALAEAANISTRGLEEIERGRSRSPHEATITLLVKAFSLNNEDTERFKLAAKKGAYHRAEYNNVRTQMGDATPYVRNRNPNGVFCGKHGATMMFSRQEEANEYVRKNVIRGKQIHRATIIQYSGHQFYSLLSDMVAASKVSETGDVPVSLYVQAPNIARTLGSEHQAARIQQLQGDISEMLSDYLDRIEVRFYDVPATISGALIEMDQGEVILMLGWYTYEGVPDNKGVPGFGGDRILADTIQVSGHDRASIVSWKGTDTYAVLLPTFAALRDNLQQIAHRDAERSDDLVRFFGKDLAQAPVFVYPDFEVDKKMLGDQPLVFHRTNLGSRTQVLQTINLTYVVAHQDLEAMIFVNESLRGRPSYPRLMNDASMSNDHYQRAFISFGLTSNECTYIYLRKTRAHPLFEIQVGDKNILENINNSFSRRPNEPLSLYLPATEERYMRDETRQPPYGLIVRYSPDRVRYPERRWFLIGGLGADGTSGAGWYLAEHWRELSMQIDGQRDAGQDDGRDFIALFECTQNAPNTNIIKALHVYNHHTKKVEPLPVDGLP